MQTIAHVFYCFLNVKKNNVCIKKLNLQQKTRQTLIVASINLLWKQEAMCLGEGKWNKLFWQEQPNIPKNITNLKKQNDEAGKIQIPC